VFGCALALNKEIDEKGIEDMKGLSNEFKRSWTEMKKIRHFPEIYLTVLYIFLAGFLLNPTFAEFSTYYIMNVRQIH
jgi:hypothetical protein